MLSRDVSKSSVVWKRQEKVEFNEEPTPLQVKSNGSYSCSCKRCAESERVTQINKMEYCQSRDGTNERRNAGRYERKNSYKTDNELTQNAGRNDSTARQHTARNSETTGQCDLTNKHSDVTQEQYQQQSAEVVKKSDGDACKCDVTRDSDENALGSSSKSEENAAESKGITNSGNNTWSDINDSKSKDLKQELIAENQSNTNKNVCDFSEMSSQVSSVQNSDDFNEDTTAPQNVNPYETDLENKDNPGFFSDAESTTANYSRCSRSYFNCRPRCCFCNRCSSYYCWRPKYTSSPLSNFPSPNASYNGDGEPESKRRRVEAICKELNTGNENFNCSCRGDDINANHRDTITAYDETYDPRKRLCVNASRRECEQNSTRQSEILNATCRGKNRNLLGSYKENDELNATRSNNNETIRTRKDKACSNTSQRNPNEVSATRRSNECLNCTCGCNDRNLSRRSLRYYNQTTGTYNEGNATAHIYENARMYNDESARIHNTTTRTCNDERARAYNDENGRIYNDTSRTYNDKNARACNDERARAYNDEKAIIRNATNRTCNDERARAYNDENGRIYNDTSRTYSDESGRIYNDPTAVYDEKCNRKYRRDGGIPFYEEGCRPRNTTFWLYERTPRKRNETYGAIHDEEENIYRSDGRYNWKCETCERSNRQSNAPQKIDDCYTCTRPRNDTHEPECSRKSITTQTDLNNEDPAKPNEKSTQTSWTLDNETKQFTDSSFYIQEPACTECNEANIIQSKREKVEPKKWNVDKPKDISPGSVKYEGYYKNAYLNYYVRLFREDKFKGKPARYVAQYAGKQWRQYLSEKEKRPYYEMRKNAAPRVRKARRK